MGKQDFNGDQKGNANNQTQPVPINFNETDRQLLNILQGDFPIVEKPWKEIGAKLCLTENEVISRLKQFYESGIIQKIGPFIDGRKIGLTVATLVAMKVPKNKIDYVACIINQHTSISHNYEREHEYNVWFTITAPNIEKLTSILEEIQQKTGIKQEDVLNLPTVNRFKINMRLQLT